ncbi:MAG: hypothetical protein E7375_04100 [Clostridiales bacterium]|nr:hypothetical protein [Clostridiales bacterium]
MIAYIITIVACVIAGIFALLVNVWTGFMYFVLATLLLLALFWTAWLVLQYFRSFKFKLEENFKYYKAEVINRNNMSIEMFNANESAYRKEYNKKMRKEKVLYWLKVVFAFAIAVTFAVSMFLL